ncbi:Uncharacterised protein [Mycobacteroides abscessus subsp. abscessus]|nr:Uncharacterised protein [Mycobacteroides abscessus subsp. abscessus]
MRIAGEVELRGDELMLRRMDLEVHVRGTPRMPSGRLDELAARPLCGDLVGRRPNRVDLIPTLVVGDEGPAQIPFGQTRRELRVEAEIVGMPELELRPRQGSSVGRRHLALEDERCARFVRAHWDGSVPWQLR